MHGSFQPSLQGLRHDLATSQLDHTVRTAWWPALSRSTRSDRKGGRQMCIMLVGPYRGSMTRQSQQQPVESREQSGNPPVV